MIVDTTTPRLREQKDQVFKIKCAVVEASLGHMRLKSSQIKKSAECGGACL